VRDILNVSNISMNDGRVWLLILGIDCYLGGTKHLNGKV